jgi:hypothetical protein
MLRKLIPTNFLNMHLVKIVPLALCFKELQKMRAHHALHLAVEQFQQKGGAVPGLKKDKEKYNRVARRYLSIQVI